ncbi:MAG: L-aspartate oxidase [Promethearchaeota archaeon]
MPREKHRLFADNLHLGKAPIKLRGRKKRTATFFAPIGLDFPSDFLVIGSGVAGLSVAYKIAPHGTVNVVTKREASESNSTYAQGGIAAVLSKVDSFEAHVADTLSCGDGACDPAVVKAIVRQGPERIRELVDLGVHFTTRGDGNELDLGKEGGHSKRRVAHAEDLTGREVQRVLLDTVKHTDGVTVFEDHLAINLVVRDGRCIGAHVYDKKGKEVHSFPAKVTILATGGAGKVYLYTSNPDVATGDGIAMAFRAGAPVANMEFTQFHPTILYHPYAKSFLISEAVRGEGALLVNGEGKRIMEGVHPLAELAPRDMVARTIDFELKKTGAECVYLDLRHLDPQFVKKRFPGISARCLEFGIDITRDLVPVVPAAHYMCGGVVAGIDGRTSINGLLAIGEVTCTGLHGANRLASNSLLEALVCAHNAAKTCAEMLGSETGRQVPRVPAWEPGDAVDSDEQVVVTQNWHEIREFMWNYVGIARTTKRLQRAMARIRLLRREIDQYYWDFVVTSDLIELRNVALVAHLIIESAMRRRESRGTHYTADFPHKSREWKPTVLRRGDLN